MRTIYGVNLKRVIGREGIRFLGFYYQSDEIQRMFRENTGTEVDIRVDFWDIGEITVFDGKFSYRVGSQFGFLKGVSFWKVTALLEEINLVDTEYTDRTQDTVDEAFEYIDGIAEISRAMHNLASPVPTSEMCDRLERRIRRALHIVPESDYTRAVRDQDWRLTPFLEEAWGLGDELEEDDLDVPSSQSKKAQEEKYGAPTRGKPSADQKAKAIENPRSTEQLSLPASKTAIYRDDF
ncbi:Mu transposase C-terminal domain-containing protein [Rhizobium sp. CB3060]|uniref:Mu transposase C-terminal domain-containing protein n=1 Tax=Rhizobium sp. CB3060 TaxID=3138255 RepID=UPI0021A5C5BF|nr:Mu transposase C-terminal domain-containing protein [Rhizobium tropici]UWU22451.1 Mu transposase C-terminal domain-containing protein [Rhizobium tropici]